MNPGIRAVYQFGTAQYPVFIVSHLLQKYDEKVDLWSVGALLYNCLAGFPGFFFTDPVGQDMFLRIYVESTFSIVRLVVEVQVSAQDLKGKA